MSEEWRTQGELQTVKVEAPESSASPAAETPAEKQENISLESRHEAPATPRPPRIAVLSLHGMGQQIPFETVDQVQRNFCAAASRQGVDLPQPSVRVAKVGDEVLRRAEIRMERGEVHFYEAYWAPLTEGRVGLRDVVSFLRAGGGNGLRHSLKISPSWRFMFERRFPFPRSIANALYLTLALLAVSSLVALNAIILGVAAATNWLPAPPGWLRDAQALQDDLTGVASLVCLIGATFGSCLFLAMTRRDLARGKLWRLPSLQRIVLDLLFYATLLVLIASAATMAWLIKQHTDPTAHASVLNPLLGGDAQALQLATVTTAATVLMVLIALAAWLANLVFGKLLATVARLVVNGCFFLVAAVAAGAGGYLLALLLGLDVPSFSPRGLPAPLAWLFDNRRLWVWAALISLSAFARSFLIQYLGDVAAYVSPHKLDRFNEIRERIREEVFKTACALYAARSADGTPEYDQVALVGHSLGSVVAYDTLNYLINKDLLSDAPLDVNNRTCLLLTFGSPLDKIAYLFQIQGTRTSDTREALASAVQPLIRSYDYRKFKWINVYSKDDIISGSLDLFDDGTGNAQRVQNEEDTYSSIPLVAHTEYWRTPLVWDHLYDQITTS
jgi:hypothetical protein